MRLMLLFVAQPAPGEAFPWMCPPLSPFHAVMLYHAMLRDQLAACQQVEGGRVRICFAPGVSPGYLDGDLQWQKQQGQAPAEIMAYAFHSAFETGASEVLALGIAPAVVSAEGLWIAFDALKSHSVVGGRGLLGLSRPLPALCAVEPSELAATAAAYGLGFQSVNTGLSFHDLSYLRRELKGNPERAPFCAMLANASMA